jgi:hypothetical protein
MSLGLERRGEPCGAESEVRCAEQEGRVNSGAEQRCGEVRSNRTGEISSESKESLYERI